MVQAARHWIPRIQCRRLLVHDVFCQAMRIEMLSYNDWQDKVNEFFREHLKACGMGSFRAWYWYRAVEFADAGRPDGKDPNPVLDAPNKEGKNG